MINWKVRLRNKVWWLAIVPAALLLVQAVLAVFGISIDITELSGRLVAVVEAAFVVLTLVGITADPTTSGLGDSERALGYEQPAPNAEEER